MSDKIVANYEMEFIPTGGDEELSLPSVIVDMPEVHIEAKRKFRNRVLVLSIGILVLGTLVYLIYANLMDGSGISNGASREVTLTVRVVPENASVDVDGRPVEGHPPTVVLEASGEFRTIRAQAKGYETLSKDVKIQESQEVVLELLRAVERKAPEPVEAPQIQEVAAAELDSAVLEDDALADDGEAEDEMEIEPDEVDFSPDKPSRVVRAAPRPREPVAKRPVAAVVSPAKPEKTVSTSPTRASGASGNPYAGPTAGSVPAVTATGTLSIRVPDGTQGPVAVSVNNRRHGNAPVSVKVEPGLHEIVFTYKGNRIFRMVNVKAGEVKRVVPDL